MISVLLSFLRVIYVALLVTEIIWIFPTTIRALTKRTRNDDMLFMLFWGLAFNRLWFFAHAVSFNDAPGYGADIALLTASYLFAITVETLVLVAYYWRQKDAS